MYLEGHGLYKGLGFGVEGSELRVEHLGFRG